MSTASSKQKSRCVDEDDDLDDLDDVLDEFSVPPPPQPAPAVASTPAPPTHSAAEAHANDPVMDELTAEMESMFSDLLVGIDRGAGEPPESAGADGVGAAAQEREQMTKFAAAWEAMLVEDMSTQSAPKSSSAQSGTDFQSQIRSTLGRLRERESGLKSSDSGASADGGDSLESLLSKLGQQGGLDGDGLESDEQLQEVLKGMMGQLMSKEVLYEPLKELHEKFPEYLTEHASTISNEDKRRYEAQIACIKQLLDEFEAKSYNDDDERAQEQIVELMSELQAHGSPPEEIMGPLPPGFSMGPDGLPNMPDGCTIS